MTTGVEISNHGQWSCRANGGMCAALSTPANAESGGHSSQLDHRPGASQSTVRMTEELKVSITEKDAPLTREEIENISDLVGFNDYGVLERLVRHLTGSTSVKFPFDVVRAEALVWKPDPKKVFPTPIKDLFLSKIPLQLGAGGRLGLKSRLSAKLNKDRELEQRINKGVCAVKSATVSQLLEIAEVVGLLAAVIDNSKILSTPSCTPTRRRSLSDAEAINSCQQLRPKDFQSSIANGVESSTGINNSRRKRTKPCLLSSSLSAEDGSTSSHDPPSVEDSHFRPTKRRRSSTSTTASSSSPESSFASLLMRSAAAMPPVDLPPPLESVVAPCVATPTTTTSTAAGATKQNLLTQEEVLACIAENPSPLSTRQGEAVGLSAYRGGGTIASQKKQLMAASTSSSKTMESTSLATSSIRPSIVDRSKIHLRRRLHHHHHHYRGSPSLRASMCNADGTIRRSDSQMHRGWPKDDDYAHAWLAAREQTSNYAELYQLVDRYMTDVRSPLWKLPAVGDGAFYLTE